MYVLVMWPVHPFDCVYLSTVSVCVCVCVRVRVRVRVRVCVCLGYWGEGKREVGMAYVRRPRVRFPQSRCRLRL